ncbi:E3 binding domain-containing protein [Deinococcus multiflagellatus]|uniref:E3 binding domain-containing protein n=1 Tax=Deinococcus multiflagellatus TaxID=1656887 RepID=A0ABW1ZKB2_9DEIO|nr:E3 binding domain-containing protein [Deinococcus multiflagellatus]MBZ9713308.1 E3 binding domain-containing protein [Deinococcus multiflagellatus]
MERIAPLAKVLAEANGIDWQKIQGSGAGGQIVEQDILNYLSRVMSGEEDPPDTPVDLPPPDWNGEEVPSAAMLNQAGMNADMLSRAGVDTDLTAFVEQTRTASPEVPATPAPSNLDEDTEFELDDEPEVTPAAAAPAPMPEPIPAPVAPAVSAPMPEPVMPAAQAPMPEPTPAPVTPPPAAPAAAGGLSSLLSRLYQKPAQPEAAQPAPTPEPVAPVAPAPEPVVAPVAAQAEPVAPAPAASPVMETPAPMPEPTPVLPEVAAQPTEVEAPAPVDETPAPVVSEPVVSTPAMPEPEPVAASAPVAPAPVAEPAPMPEPVAAPTMPEVAAQPEPAAQPAPMPAAVSAPTGTPAGSVWFGAYLRRSADVAALHDLRGQVSRALASELPLGLLVARAAQRHADTLGLSSVALDGQGRTHTVGSGSLRDAVAALDTTFDGTPDLLVVDAAALDLDDLHYPQTVTLSVGRSEGGRATLSLNGDVDTTRAAQFLAQVAATLEQPILLVL